MYTHDKQRLLLAPPQIYLHFKSTTAYTTDGQVDSTDRRPGMSIPIYLWLLRSMSQLEYYTDGFGFPFQLDSVIGGSIVLFLWV